MESLAARSTSGISRPSRSAGALNYPFEAPPSDGTLVEVAPGVLWGRMPMPMPLDHINVYLLRHQDGWICVDTGLNTEATKNVWETVVREKLGGLPLKGMICTHFHYDHAGLAQWISERFQVPLYMTYGEYYMMRASYAPVSECIPSAQQLFWQRAGMPTELALALHEALRKDVFMPTPATSFRRLADGHVLRIGDRRWQVVIGSGHSPEHACLYCEQDRLLIAGDQLLPGISSNVQVTATEPDGNPLQDWFDSLERLDRLDAATLILPSHQKVFLGLRNRVGELREHHALQLDQLMHFIADCGVCTAFDAMKMQFPRLLNPVENLLALGETIAHLSWLRFAGRLQRTLDLDGIYRFSVTDAGQPNDTKEIPYE